MADVEPKSEQKTRPLVSLIRLLALPFRYKASSAILSFLTALACVYALRAIGVQFGVSPAVAVLLLVGMVLFYLAYLSVLAGLFARREKG
jgi:fatty acid desaturase